MGVAKYIVHLRYPRRSRVRSCQSEDVLLSPRFRNKAGVPRLDEELQGRGVDEDSNMISTMRMTGTGINDFLPKMSVERSNHHEKL